MLKFIPLFLLISIAMTPSITLAAKRGGGIGTGGFNVNAGLGITSLSFKEAGIADYSSTNLTLKAGMNYHFPSAWIIGLSGYATLSQLKKSTDVSVRYFGLNARLGYQFPSVSNWTFTLYGGAYYSTMFVTNNVFGFKNLAGPQIYPELRKSFNNGSAIIVYVKFCPVSEGVTTFSTTNREVAAGAAYLHPLFSGHPISLSIDYSNIYFTASPLITQTSSITISLGYGF